MSDNKLEQYKDTAENTLRKIMDHTGADAAMIVVVKGDSLLSTPGIRHPRGIAGLFAVMQSTERAIKESIADSIPPEIISDKPPTNGCDCPLCTLKRELQAKKEGMVH